MLLNLVLPQAMPQAPQALYLNERFVLIIPRQQFDGLQWSRHLLYSLSHQATSRDSPFQVHLGGQRICLRQDLEDCRPLHQAQGSQPRQRPERPPQELDLSSPQAHNEVTIKY